MSPLHSRLQDYAWLWWWTANRGSNLSGSALWKVESCVEARAETRREICSVYREIRTRRGRKYPNTHRMFTLLMQSNGRVKS